MILNAPVFNLKFSLSQMVSNMGIIIDPLSPLPMIADFVSHFNN